jgi:hypothetical protein
MNKLYIYSINFDHRTSYFKSPPIKFMEMSNWKLLNYNDKIINEHYDFINYLKTNNIKIIMCFCCC